MGGKGSGRKQKDLEAAEMPTEEKPVCKETEWTVEINQQKDRFNTLDKALGYARNLLDAKVWFFKVSSKDRDC